MSTAEKAFCDLTEYYYSKWLSLEEAMIKATILLGK